MLIFPNAKINIGLNVVAKREDGYHNIETCLYPIPWRDILEIVPSEHPDFKSTGLPITGKPEENLCLKAYHLLQKDFDLPPVHIHLHKIIPMGAGLGGGSSDGAHTLKGLDQIFDLQLGSERLREYAGQLGSDCPFFIENLPTLATGTGTELKPLDQPDLSGHHILVIYPGVHVSTRDAYGGVTPSAPETPLSSQIVEPIVSWQGQVHNDFEISVFKKHPKLAQIKEKLIHMGALYASMSGSGSAVYGIFDSAPEIDVSFGYPHFVSVLNG